MSKNWTFLGHHAHILIALSNNPDYKLDELAEILGMTTRSVVNVVNDLVEGGYLTKSRDGRRNHYEIDYSAPLRHHTSATKTVGDLIEHLSRFN
jgi:DNA-binding IclR family transcriptional regulator